MIEYKNFKDECGIYCFTNKINGKCYVGQGINLKKRLRSHYSAMKKQNIGNMIFYAAVSKYGIENFDLDILEFLDPTIDRDKLKDLLDEKEKFYIKEKNSYVPNGYNQTIGGDAGVLGYKMTEEQKDKIRTGVQKYKDTSKKHIWVRNISEPKYSFGCTYEEASKKSGVSVDVIRHICNNNYKSPYAKGWTFAFDEITLFHNCASALRDMANGKYNNTGGKFIVGHISKNTKRAVIELNNSGEIIAEFDSVKTAAAELNCNVNTFSNYLHNEKRIKFLGRIFKFKIPPVKRKYSEQHFLNLRNRKKETKHVGQYDLQNNLITIHNSAKDAARKVDTDIKSIYRCCHKRAKTCKGFIWKFED